MDTPMPCVKESVESVLAQIKPEVRRMKSYDPPPHGKVIAKLNQNENGYELPDSMKDCILREMQYTPWSRYPDYDQLSLRSKLALRYNLNPDQIVLSNGSNGLIYALMSALISPGDGILIAPPSFPLFEVAGQIHQARLIPVPVKPDFSYDEAALLNAAVNSKLAIFSYPCNPTGAVMDLELVRNLLESINGFVLMDEAYGEFWNDSAVPLIEEYPNLLVLRTFSKAMGLAGLRVGYLMGHPEVVQEIRKVTVPYSVNGFSARVASRILDIPQWIDDHVEKIIFERDVMLKRLSAIPGVTPYPSLANFLLFRVDDGKRVFSELCQKGILIRDMRGYPELDNCFRVTVGTPRENVLFLEALTSIMKS